MLLRKEGVNFRTTAEFEIVRTIKEKACYLANNPQKEETVETEKYQYTLPDGSTLEVWPFFSVYFSRLFYKDFCYQVFPRNTIHSVSSEESKVFNADRTWSVSNGCNVYYVRTHICFPPPKKNRYYLQPVCMICVTVVCYCILWCQFSRVAVCATVGTIVHVIE